MTFPASAFYFVGEVWDDDKQSYEDEWALDCDFCHKTERFAGYMHKVVDVPEDEGWDLIDGHAVCDLCCHEGTII